MFYFSMPDNARRRASPPICFSKSATGILGHSQKPSKAPAFFATVPRVPRIFHSLLPYGFRSCVSSCPLTSDFRLLPSDFRFPSPWSASWRTSSLHQSLVISRVFFWSARFATYFSSHSDAQRKQSQRNISKHVFHCQPKNYAQIITPRRSCSPSVFVKECRTAFAIRRSASMSVHSALVLLRCRLRCRRFDGQPFREPGCGRSPDRATMPTEGLLFRFSHRLFAKLRPRNRRQRTAARHYSHSIAKVCYFANRFFRPKKTMTAEPFRRRKRGGNQFPIRFPPPFRLIYPRKLTSDGA
jgi:hypothetical protein